MPEQMLDEILEIKRQGYTQEEFADKIGIPLNRLKYILNGHADPKNAADHITLIRRTINNGK